MLNNKGKTNMLIPTIIIGIIAITLTIIYYKNNTAFPSESVNWTFWMILKILPLLIFAFMTASLMQELISQAFISKWVGTESGFRGILIGTLAGSLTPGGPFVCFPIVAILFKSGASVGTAVAFITGWSLISLNRLPLEIGIVGWKFTAIRLACTFFLPPIAGIIAQVFFKNFKLSL
ncbi:MAG: permease [Pseudomonadota bacterium]